MKNSFGFLIKLNAKSDFHVHRARRRFEFFADGRNLYDELISLHFLLKLFLLLKVLDFFFASTFCFL